MKRFEDTSEDELGSSIDPSNKPKRRYNSVRRSSSKIADKYILIIKLMLVFDIILSKI